MQSLKERKRRAADRLRRWRHEKGISERYYTGVRIPQKYYTKRHRALMKKAGPLSIKTIQMVYEDNIKKYGTLTCIYCLEPIRFGQDNLEHKTPLIRGGSNCYSNLGIACFKCNRSKSTKTEIEYRRWKNEVIADRGSETTDDGPRKEVPNKGSGQAS